MRRRVEEDEEEGHEAQREGSIIDRKIMIDI